MGPGDGDSLRTPGSCPTRIFRILLRMTQPDLALLLHCSSCDRDKPRGWFRRSGVGRRSSWCRECRSGVDIKHAAIRRGALVAPIPRHWQRLLWVRQQGRCRICGEALVWRCWHVDHIKAIARGGRHEYGNLALTHGACNLAKGAK